MHHKKKILIFLFLITYLMVVNLADGFFVLSPINRKCIENITLAVFSAAAIFYGYSIGRHVVGKSFFILLFLIVFGFLHLILQPAFEKIKLHGFWLKSRDVVEDQCYLSCCDSILRNWSLLNETFAKESYDTVLPPCIKENISKLKISPHVILVKHDKEIYIRLEYPNYAISCAMGSSHPLSLVGAKVAGRIYYTYSQRPFKTWQIKKSLLDQK